MEKVIKEIHIRTEAFEKGFIAMQQLVLPFELNEKMRVVIDYDPQKVSTKVRYFKIEG